MIVVRIELWPKGDRAKAVLLGEVTMVNDGQRRDGKGDYEVSCRGKRGRPLRRRTYLTGFPRRSKTAFHLLKLVLASLGY